MNRLTGPSSPLRLNSATSFLTRSLSPPSSSLRHPAFLVLAQTLASKDSPKPHSVNFSREEPLHTDNTVATAAAEDYVHIEDLNPSAEILGKSFVGVEDKPRENKDGAFDSVMMTEGGGGVRDGLDWTRATLPEELSRTVTVLSSESSAPGGICDVYVVGTNHVSRDSCREVQAVISFLKPEVVFLELCASRVAVLSARNRKVPTMGEMVKLWKKKKHNAFGIIYSWFLAQVAQKLDVLPGSEFRVAYEAARKYGGKVILGDRPVQITLQRSWAKMPIWHKWKLIRSLLFQALFLPSPNDLNKMVKDMNDVDMMTRLIQEMSKQFPTLMDTLVRERDQYMSHTLLKAAHQHNSVVAVVGKGHVRGIVRHWNQPVKLEDLLQVHPRRQGLTVFKMLSSVGVAVASVAIVAGLYVGWKK